MTDFPINPIAEHLNWAITSIAQTKEDVNMGFGDESDIQHFRNEANWAINEMYEMFDMDTPEMFCYPTYKSW